MPKRWRSTLFYALPFCFWFEFEARSIVIKHNSMQPIVIVINSINENSATCNSMFFYDLQSKNVARTVGKFSFCNSFSGYVLVISYQHQVLQKKVYLLFVCHGEKFLVTFSIFELVWSLTVCPTELLTLQKLLSLHTFWKT